MKTLKALFLGELADMYDAERRIVKALPKMAAAATCDKLKKAILAHLKETGRPCEEARAGLSIL
jgi:ferritin-like metal-binding protein YciE